MDLKQIKAVLEAIPEPTAELKSAISDIETFYNEASANTSKYEGLQTKLTEIEQKERDASIDMMKYKSKLESAELKLDERNKQITDFDTKYKDFETLKSENETLKTYKVERDTTIRSDYQKRIDEYSKKEAFEKVKGKIVMPSDEKKLEELTIEEIASSNKELDMARDYGLFGASGSQTPPGAGQEEETEGSVMAQLDAMNIPRPNK